MRVEDNIPFPPYQENSVIHQPRADRTLRRGGPHACPSAGAIRDWGRLLQEIVDPCPRTRHSVVPEEQRRRLLGSPLRGLVDKDSEASGRRQVRQKDHQPRTHQHHQAESNEQLDKKLILIDGPGELVPHAVHGNHIAGVARVGLQLIS